MYKVEEFRREHMEILLKDPLNLEIRHLIESGVVDTLVGTNSHTIFFGDEILFCGGISNFWANRGVVWSTFSSSSKFHFVAVFRILKAWLKEQINKTYLRIEVSIPYVFRQGKRRAQMLGFEVEIERARRYHPNGEDCTVFVMVRE